MEIEWGDSWARVTLSGDVDLQWIETHEEALNDLCDDAPAHILLDLEAVTFMDSSGFGLMARLCHSCRAKDGFVYILRPSGPVLMGMETVGLTRVNQIVIADTTEKVSHISQHFTALERA